MRLEELKDGLECCKDNWSFVKGCLLVRLANLEERGVNSELELLIRQLEQRNDFPLVHEI